MRHRTEQGALRLVHTGAVVTREYSYINLRCYICGMFLLSREEAGERAGVAVVQACD